MHDTTETSGSLTPSFVVVADFDFALFFSLAAAVVRMDACPCVPAASFLDWLSLPGPSARSGRPLSPSPKEDLNGILGVLGTGRQGTATGVSMRLGEQANYKVGSPRGDGGTTGESEPSSLRKNLPNGPPFLLRPVLRNLASFSSLGLQTRYKARSTPELGNKAHIPLGSTPPAPLIGIICGNGCWGCVVPVAAF